MREIKCCRCGNMTQKIYKSTNRTRFGGWSYNGFLCLNCAESDYKYKEEIVMRYVNGLKESLSKRRGKLHRLRVANCEHEWRCTNCGKNDFVNKIFLIEYVCNKCGETEWRDYSGKSH